MSERVWLLLDIIRFQTSFMRALIYITLLTFKTLAIYIFFNTSKDFSTEEQ